ncbi:3-methyl-2-oxobutanoate hydroxymethyltransferase [Cryptococcus wingfieldii CBS 7118]|uniref:3-methyl-2-oxobutanoate hydroxymethyltransferase n=1 Tax=Cryptococcus wingfieldii CBS 7118 TaxID=1295528 RepID=A0A1E3IBG5_9TREE|nr:3-methyl-2-oxobutanoate hydroxymethyltransferase [Cryptococcus wingfieldii CBS 7118]ODN85256.1 3-methyl-2-oxobutanoate hydroxymethyltransferase [Cryptococcus wingfieldii CBS 7118]
MVPRVHRLLRQNSLLSIRPRTTSISPSTSLLRRSVATENQIHQPVHPELDDSFKDLIENGMAMGMGLKGKDRVSLPRRILEELEYADVRDSNSGMELEGSLIEPSTAGDGLVIDEPPTDARAKAGEEYDAYGREERRSPAAVLGSKRLGMVVLPEEMRDGIQRQISMLDNPRDLRKSYLSLPDMPLPANAPKPNPREKTFRTPEGELAKASAILPGEYSAVKNVLEEMERRLGSAWTKGVKEGEIVEFSPGLGSGLWASLDTFGGLHSTRRLSEHGQPPLKYQFVHPSRHGLDLLQKITEAIPKESANIQYNRKHSPTSTPSLILSTFHLASFPTPQTQQLYLRQLLSFDSPYIIIIDRATPQGWAAISKARSYVLQQSTPENPLHIAAPCPHDSKCPLLDTREVCGYTQRLQRPSFLRKTKHSTRGEEVKGYCYLVVAKGERPVAGQVSESIKALGRTGKVGREAAEKALAKSQGRAVLREVEGHEAILEVVPEYEAAPEQNAAAEVDEAELETSLRKEAYSWPRLVASPMKRKGHVTMDACTAEGNIQRITFSKSLSKQSYHDARKASWGDLFPHSPKAKPVIRDRGIRRLNQPENFEDSDALIAELLEANAEEEMDERSSLEELEAMGIKLPQAADIVRETQGPFAKGQRRRYTTASHLWPLPRPFAPSQRRSMSARPVASPQIIRTKKTLASLLTQAQSGEPITCLTAYDYPTALLSETCDLDMCLVGDSLSQVSLGHETTTSVTLDDIIHHARAVVRGAKSPFVFADMPFGSFEASMEEGVRNALRMIKEGGVDGIKIEGGLEIVPLVQRLTSIGIPVMPHIGLQPQRAVSLSGYLVQGRTAASAYETIQTARALADAGAFAFLLEAMPRDLGKLITEEMVKRGVFTIGIGAGKGTSGQVLVVTDVLGIYADDPLDSTPAVSPETTTVPASAAEMVKPAFAPRFVRQFGNLGAEMRRAVRGYVASVRDGSFPSTKESYGMKKEEWEGLLRLLDIEKAER